MAAFKGKTGFSAGETEIRAPPPDFEKIRRFKDFINQMGVWFTQVRRLVPFVSSKIRNHLKTRPQRPKNYDSDDDSERNFPNGHLAASLLKMRADFTDRVPLVLPIAHNLVSHFDGTRAPHTLNLRKCKRPGRLTILSNPIKVGHLFSIIIRRFASQRYLDPGINISKIYYLGSLSAGVTGKLDLALQWSKKSPTRSRRILNPTLSQLLPFSTSGERKKHVPFGGKPESRSQQSSAFKR
jgi:hypothetical protein